MIRFGNSQSTKIIFFVLFFIIFAIKPNGFSQDLRDKEHTVKFADYLFQSGQFSLAAEEYERLVYTNPEDKHFKLRLLQSYRKSGKFSPAISRFEYFYKDSLFKLENKLSEEYIKNLILSNENEKALDFLNLPLGFEPIKKQNYELSVLLLQKNWDKAFEYALKNPVLKDKKNADLHVLAFRTKEIRYKSPFVAGLFSTVIPGTGKIYTKHWKDGLISMLMVGVNVWQSYRGFNKYGSNSAYGWVFSGFAGSFYIGNIFGSARSAKKYNQKLDENVHHEAWHLIVDDF